MQKKLPMLQILIRKVSTNRQFTVGIFWLPERNVNKIQNIRNSWH